MSAVALKRQMQMQMHMSQFVVFVGWVTRYITVDACFCLFVCFMYFSVLTESAHTNVDPQSGRIVLAAERKEEL
jgi:hypothetical protein